MSKLGKGLRAPALGKLGRGLRAPRVRVGLLGKALRTETAKPGRLGGELGRRKLGQSTNLGRTMVTDLTSGTKRKPRGRPVDLMSALNFAKNLPNASIAADSLRIQTDKRVFELPLAEAVATQVRANILDGRNPSGRRGKPLRPETLRKREGNGPRGVNTGQMVASIRLVEHPDYVGVAIDQSAPGQFSRAFGGARWTYNPEDKIVRAALEALVDLLVVDDG